MTFHAMLAMVPPHLKLAKSDEPSTKGEQLHRLNEFARRLWSSRANALLLLDEAKNLDCYQLENLFLMSCVVT